MEMDSMMPEKNLTEGQFSAEDPKNMTPDYICTHYFEDPKRYLDAVSTPIFMTSSFSLGSPYHYSRDGNPNFEIVEKKVAALDHAKGSVFFGSGIGAISAALFLHLQAGDHCVMVRTAYPGTRSTITDMERFGVSHTFVQGPDISEFEKAIQPNTKLIYLESPSSIVYEMQDLKAIADLAKSKGIKTAIDNTAGTPIFQNPIDFGIDTVCYSASKYFGGHSDIVGGFVVSNDEEALERLVNLRIRYGACTSPFNAWLIERGMRTLTVRLERHYATAKQIVKFLEHHPAVEEVIHPEAESFPQKELYKKQMRGFGGQFSLKTKGSFEQNKEFISRLRVFENAVSWGGFESLVYDLGQTKELKTETAKLAFHGGVIRMYAGLEGADLLCEDLEQALKAIK